MSNFRFRRRHSVLFCCTQLSATMSPLDVVATISRSTVAVLATTVFLTLAAFSPSVPKVDAFASASAVEKARQTVATPGCSTAVWLGGEKLCCQGKNNTCRTEGPRMSNNGSVTCFCDSECYVLQDCCTDYKETCLRKYSNNKCGFTALVG